MGPESVEYRVSPRITSDELNRLFAASWPNHQWTDFGPVLARSLAYVCAYAAGSASEHLAGYVNLAWDGGGHAFLLDTTVHPDLRRRGIGRQLVHRAIDVARARGLDWMHVVFEPHLRTFYLGCGFRCTDAGVLAFTLKRPSSSDARRTEPEYLAAP